MIHLTPHELVEAAEDLPAGAARFPHLASCAACARAVASMRETMADLRTHDVPEPSPLFWDHFALRVREATAEVAVPARGGWWLAAWRPALATAALLAVVVLGWRMAAPDPATSIHEMAATGGAPTPPPAPGAEPPRTSDDAPLAAAPPVETLADAVTDDRDWLEASGLSGALAPESVESLATPGAGVFLAEELNPRELQEFARLLRAELGGLQ